MKYTIVIGIIVLHFVLGIALLIYKISTAKGVDSIKKEKDENTTQ